MYQAMVHDTKAGEGSNKIVYWSRRLDWKNQTLTPNPDTIYFQAFFNTESPRRFRRLHLLRRGWSRGETIKQLPGRAA